MLLWALSEPERISPQIRQEIETPVNAILVSSISIAEIIVKSSIEKLVLNFDPIDAVKRSGFDFLDFTAHDAVLLKELPYHHRDPFDRMLIAQSIANKCHIMSEDRNFKLYSCKLISS